MPTECRRPCSVRSSGMPAALRTLIQSRATESRAPRAGGKTSASATASSGLISAKCDSGHGGQPDKLHCGSLPAALTRKLCAFGVAQCDLAAREVDLPPAQLLGLPAAQTGTGKQHEEGARQWAQRFCGHHLVQGREQVRVFSRRRDHHVARPVGAQLQLPQVERQRLEPASRSLPTSGSRPAAEASFSPRPVRPGARPRRFVRVSSVIRRCSLRATSSVTAVGLYRSDMVDDVRCYPCPVVGLHHVRLSGEGRGGEVFVCQLRMLGTARLRRCSSSGSCPVSTSINIRRAAVRASSADVVLWIADFLAALRAVGCGVAGKKPGAPVRLHAEGEPSQLGVEDRRVFFGRVGEHACAPGHR